MDICASFTSLHHLVLLSRKTWIDFSLPHPQIFSLIFFYYCNCVKCWSAMLKMRQHFFCGSKRCHVSYFYYVSCIIWIVVFFPEFWHTSQNYFYDMLGQEVTAKPFCHWKTIQKYHQSFLTETEEIFPDSNWSFSVQVLRYWYLHLFSLK